jgi:Fibronectin type III domain/NHL repeat/WD40-like Beta Propeller Repeat
MNTPTDGRSEGPRHEADAEPPVRHLRTKGIWVSKLSRSRRSLVRRSGGGGDRVGGGAPSLRPAGMAFAGLLAVVVMLVAGSASAAPPAEFGSEGTGAGQFEGPRGIAVEQSSGDVYVADRNNARIDKFGPNGEFLLAWGWGVADGTATLQTCTTVCFKGLHGPGAGQLNEPEGIAVDNSGGASEGDVYVLETGNQRIQKFGPDGEFITGFGEAGTGPGQFQTLNGRSVAVDSSGSVYVADEDRVQKFSPAGIVEEQFAIPGAGLISNLVVDSAGDLYLSGSGLEGVHKYEPTTPTATELGTPRDEGGERGLLAITVGPADELFVNDYRSGVHRLLGYDSAGVQISSFDGGPEARDGSGGIAYADGAGGIFVLQEPSVRFVTPPPPGPFVLPGTESATEITPTSATLGATINPEGGEEVTYAFQYGATTSYGEETAPTELTGGPFEDQPASATLTGLAVRTTYHYRVEATDKAGETNFGPDQTFATLPPVSIESTSASRVTATSATLEATLNPHGKLSTYRFEYGPTGSYGTTVPVGGGTLGSGTVGVARSVQIQGLTPDTTYHYRVVAENELGEGLNASFGPDRTFTTQGTVAALLPDDRGWELVSPANKHGATIEPITEEGGTVKVAAAGGAFTYVANGSVTASPSGARSPEMSQLFSRRGADGWTSEEITTPHEEISVVEVGAPAEFKFFDEDLSRSLVEPVGATPLSPLAGEDTPYRREADGELVPLVTAANTLPGVKFGGEEFPVGSGRFPESPFAVSATPDGSDVVLRSPFVLTPGFAPGFVPAQPSLYERSEAGLRLVSVLPNGEPAAEAGLGSALGHNYLNMRGAISADGSRVIFEAGSHLYLRADALATQTGSGACDQPGGACTIQIDQPQAEAPGGSGEAIFQGASADGSRVFFTDNSRLTSDATSAPGKPDLYMCEVKVSTHGNLECDLTDLTIDANPGESASVTGTVTFSAEGSKVYFAANGVLTNVPNSRGEAPVASRCENPGDSPCNLYVYDTNSRQISLVAVLSSQDAADWDLFGNSGLANLTARSSPDGRYLAFMSQRSLTGYDNRDASSGEADEEVYLYDSQTGALHCASCDPSGARPDGVFNDGTYENRLVDYPNTWSNRWLAATIPGWTGKDLKTSLYQSRYLSNSGRLFFNSSDALVPQDSNGVMDVYEYEPPGVGSCTGSSPTFSSASGGCVGLISSGTSPSESTLLDATEDGNEVFFLTAAKLTAKDVDAANDVYDARVGGGEAPVVNPPACEGDACQPPAVPPVDATPGSLTFNGAGNVVQCPKGKVRQKGKCVKKHHKKAKKHRKKHHKKSSKKQKKGKPTPDRAAEHKLGGSR